MKDAAGPPLRLVMDTSVFTNPRTARQFGDTAEASFNTFLDLVDQASDRVRVFMPPLIYEELRTFMQDDAPVPPRFEAVVCLQAPSRYTIQVPGQLLYELIEELRGRIDRGLRVAEKAVRAAHPENVDKTIRDLRERYREVLRAGLIDSREDVDLILLALDLNAALVSSDRGVVSWAERMGVRVVQPDHLRDLLSDLVDRSLNR